MKIGIISDTHIHKFQQFGGPNGLRRLQDGLSVLEEAFAIFLDSECDMVIHLGDFFHKRRLLDVLSFNKTMDLMSRVASSDAFSNRIIIAGNHDWYDETMSTSTVEFLTGDSTKFDLVTRPSIDYIEGVYYVCVPWMPPVKQVEFLDNLVKEGVKKPNAKKVLFIHCTPKESYSATGYKFTDGVPLAKYSKFFTRIFCGDIHKRQTIGSNLHIVGAPMEMDFGDASGPRRGVHIYDTDRDHLRFIHLLYPRFIVTENPKDVNDKDYFKLTSTSPVDSDRVLNVRPTTSIKIPVRSMKVGLSNKQAITRYVELSKVKPNEVEPITNLGLELINEVSNS